MLFELRQYHIMPGRQADWVRLMEEEVIPFQVSKGMVILGSFVGEEDDSVYVWIRRFKDEAERERLYEAVYQSEHWKTQIGPRIPELMDRERINVTRLTGDTEVRDSVAEEPLPGPLHLRGEGEENLTVRRRARARVPTPTRLSNVIGYHPKRDIQRVCARRI